MRIRTGTGWLALALVTQGAQAWAAEASSAPAQDAAPGEIVATASADGELATIAVTDPRNAEPEKTAAATPSSNRLIEEVFVTSQKREEKLQDIPLSVQAFSQEKLDVLGIQTVQQIQQATPGFTVTRTAGYNLVFLRGVGSDAFLPGVDSSVPFYLDGVPLVAAMGAADNLGRVVRVEVLKGPQGTLFGRNATGGTISIVTPDPDQEAVADVNLGFGTYDQKKATLYTNIPLTDTFAFNVSAFYNFMENPNHNIVRTVSPGTGGLFNIWGKGARVKLKWDALDTVSLGFSASYQSNSGSSGFDWQMLRPAPALSLVLPADPKFDRNIQHSLTAGATSQSYIVGGSLEWKPEYFDAKITVADQKVDVQADADFDGTELFLLDGHVGGFGDSSQYIEQTTAELQILSNGNSPFSEHLEWVTGLFFLRSNGGFDPIVFNIAPDTLNAYVPGASLFTGALNTLVTSVGLRPIFGLEGILAANYGMMRSTSYSAYFQGTYHVTDAIDFTAGTRFQKETRDYYKHMTTYPLGDGREIVLPIPQGDIHKLKPEQTSARFALQWRPFGPDSQIYTSWARAYKNPTYNTVNLLGNLFGTVVPLKAERVDSTELGVKSRLFDGALQLNAAAFYIDQKNPLSSNVTIISGGIASFTNAQSARIKGFEADAMVLPMPNLNPGLAITGGFSYLDAIYSEFTNGRGYDDATGLGFGSGGLALPPRDLSGKRIPRVPEWSYQVAVNQRVDLSSDHAIEVGVDSFYTSKIYFLPQNSEYSKRDPVTTYNANVKYIYLPWDLEVSAYVINITDELYVDTTFVTDFGTTSSPNENPRQYGMSMKVSF